MKRLRTKLVLAIATLGVVAAIGGSAAAQQVCVDVVLVVQDQPPVEIHQCLPE